MVLLLHNNLKAHQHNNLKLDGNHQSTIKLQMVLLRQDNQANNMVVSRLIKCKVNQLSKCLLNSSSMLSLQLSNIVRHHQLNNTVSTNLKIMVNLHLSNMPPCSPKLSISMVSNQMVSMVNNQLSNMVSNLIRKRGPKKRKD